MSEPDPPWAERWQRIEALYHGALAVPDDARARFLRDACEVQALLAVAAPADGYVDPSVALSSGVAPVAA